MSPPPPSAEARLHRPTIHRDGAQNDPRGPLGEVLDEHQGHECADHDEVGLLQHQGALPVDAHHAHRPEVPDGEEEGGVVHGHVVGLEHLPAGPQASPWGGKLSGDVRLSEMPVDIPAHHPASLKLGFSGLWHQLLSPSPFP